MPTTDTKPRKPRTKSAKDKQTVSGIVGGFAGQPYYPPQFDPRSVQDWFSSWVYVAAKTNAIAVSKGSLRMYSRAKPVKERPSKVISRKSRVWIGKTAMSSYLTEETEEIIDHPWLRSIQYVNPILDRQSLIYLTVVSQQLSGNAYWKMFKDDMGRPVEYWWIPSHRMFPIQGKKNVFDSYRFHHRQGYTDFPADEIVHFRWPSPLEIQAGHGCLQGAYFAAETNKRMEEFENATFTNDCSMGLFITPDEDITEPNRVSLETSLINRLGGHRNAGRPLVAPMKMTIQKMNENMKDLQFPEGRKWILDQIAAAFGVPVPVILQDAAKYNNMRHGLYLWMQHTIAPIMMWIAETLNTRVMPLYDDACSPWDDFSLDKPLCKWFVCFDDPVPEDDEADSKVATADYAGGVITRNEARGIRGYEAVEDGDDFLIPSGVRTQEEIAAQTELAEAQARNPMAAMQQKPESKSYEPNVTYNIGVGKAGVQDGTETGCDVFDSERGRTAECEDVTGRPSNGIGDDTGEGLGYVNGPTKSGSVTGGGGDASEGTGVLDEAEGGIQSKDEGTGLPEGTPDSTEDRQRLIEDCTKRCRVIVGKLNETDVAPTNETDAEKINDTLNRWKEWALALLLIGDMTPLTVAPEFAIAELSRETYELYLKAISRGQALGGGEVAEIGLDPVYLNAEKIDEIARSMAVATTSEVVQSRTNELQKQVSQTEDTAVADWATIAAVAFLGSDGTLSTMIADTEYARGVNEGANETFAASGIESKMWIAQSGACQYCAPLHGTIVAVREPFKTGWTHNPSVSTPPLHPNCRCAVAAVK